jgi:hypothetical protein
MRRVKRRFVGSMRCFYLSALERRYKYGSPQFAGQADKATVPAKSGRKSARIELETVHLVQDAGFAAEKFTRTS